jgi:hypothetical protein
MKSLFAAVVLGFGIASAAGCSGGALLPATSPATASAAQTHRIAAPADCPSPNDSGGIMTGDGGTC